MRKDNQYTFDSRVRFSEVDHTGRITLPGIINYFQDCSTFQSESLGVGVDYFKEHKRAWILTYWQVVVEEYPRLAQEIHVATWATEFKKMLANRNFCMTDFDGKKLAYANSVWAYMDTEKGRPILPSKEEVDAYGQGEPLEMDYQPRKVKLPESAKKQEPFAVRKYHIDTNEHVNNCQYVQMAMEYVEYIDAIRQVRVEYKNSAVYGDMIVPKVAIEENRTVVELCGEEDQIFATVEFS
ncbi:MAG: thioesterase [Lachnospiraceae bacterium]|nr:thioesterase [Lachnospiraceae bacterium]